ncbi:MAG: restriction endonuclease subunit S, partial [Mollicutes bacterium UO1]
IITVDSSAGSGVCFYQGRPFITNGKVHKLELKKVYPPLNVYRGLFFVTILSFNRKYYEYNEARNRKRFKKESIMLPINNQGEIECKIKL